MERVEGKRGPNYLGINKVFFYNVNDDSFPEARAPFRGSVGPYPWLDVTLSPAGVLPRLYPAVLVLYLGVLLSPHNHLRFRPERAIKRKEAWTGFSKQPFFVRSH